MERHIVKDTPIDAIVYPTNVCVADLYGNEERLEDYDRYFNGEKSNKGIISDTTRIVMRYVENGKIRTDFNSLTELSRALWNAFEWSLVITPSGHICILQR